MSKNIFSVPALNEPERSLIVVSSNKVTIGGITTIRFGETWHTHGLFTGDHIVVSPPYRAVDSIRDTLMSDRARGVLNKVTRLVIGPFVAVALLLEQHLTWSSVLDAEIDCNQIHIGGLDLAGHYFTSVEISLDADPFAIATCDDQSMV